MSEFDDQWTERRRRLAFKPNAHLHIRPDAWRYMPPGAPRYSGRDVVKYFEAEFLSGKWANRGHDRPKPTAETGHDAAFEAEVAELRWMLADLRLHGAAEVRAGPQIQPQPAACAGGEC